MLNYDFPYLDIGDKVPLHPSNMSTEIRWYRLR